ncbi:MAG: RNA-splicing ligase RtcB [Termitinemataceae bacterium]|nr:MAG: RNA-splicing ligase RtcB [Termitinemataceae bacterium]
MIQITGKHNTAKVFTDKLDEFSSEQIKTLCDQSFTEGSTIRLMPDVHAGSGCTIGTTMTISDKIVPNLVGVDIGCGMETICFNAEHAFAKDFDPVKLDLLIHEQIPSGMNIRDNVHDNAKEFPFDKIRCPAIKVTRAKMSMGTLGGGNHFIEANRDENNNLYIVVHSGSRHLGLEVAEYYQCEAWRQINKNRKIDIEKYIDTLKKDRREKNIQDNINAIKAQILTDVPKDLAYVSGELFDDYINDMKITQQFAALNRKTMISIMLNGLGFYKNYSLAPNEQYEQFSTIHNYIDIDSMILRKGAVSAKAKEKLIIPMNMRDGSLVCEGCGNPDWNYSAPHGAGRLMSRKKAFSVLKMEDYKNAMQGIYSTSVTKDTIDESPMAYKNIDDIVSQLGPAATILAIIKPIYNFKASEEKTNWKEKKAAKQKKASLGIL